MKPDCYEYVRDNYRVPAYIGVRVRMGQQMGVIVKATTDLHYVHVRFDACKHADPVHPTDLFYEVEQTPAPSEVSR